MTASGDGASGIFARSSGPGGKGQLTINVQAGSTVSGGTGNAAGIRLVDGAANSIVNAGLVLVTAVQGAQGVAIRVDRASSSAVGTVQTTVTNTGAIIGQVLAAPHATIAVDNQQGGTVVTGPVMVLGAGGTVTNRGMLEVGGRRIARTAMQGTLVQTQAGRLVVDLAPVTRSRTGSADSLAVDGAVRLAARWRSARCTPASAGAAGRPSRA